MATTRTTRAQRLSDAAFACLNSHDSELQEEDKVLLPFDEELQMFGSNELRIIRTAYPSTITRISQGSLGVDLTLSLLDHMTAELERDIAERAQAQRAAFGANTISSDTPRRLVEEAFEAEYFGDADKRFAVYLERCWEAYTECPGDFVAPYVTIVQSSGFGKSRLVKQLAQSVNTTATSHSNSKKLLFTCLRESDSSGFPRATPALTAFFFPTSNPDEHEIAWRLFVAFEYASERWDSGSLGDEWMELFTSRGLSRDDALAYALTMALKSDKRWSKRAKLTRQVNDHTAFLSIAFEDSSPRVLLFVVDEARVLLDRPQCRGKSVDWLRLVCRALTLANQFVFLKHRVRGAGIFGIFVDSDPRVASYEGEAAAAALRPAPPPARGDPSARSPAPNPNKALFSPFVLTHTLDVHQKLRAQQQQGRSHVADLAQFYKTMVADQLANPWPSLSEMGRPLWRSLCSPSDESPHSWRLNASVMVHIAASKLLMGNAPGHADSFNRETMFGVASLLCRLGLRPYVSSPFASRAVADFMAVLAYVSFEHDKYVASYSSDPILALGAMCLWHSKILVLRSSARDSSSGQCPLATWILPHFRKLLLQDVVDTGRMGEVVARILLLLAMDACGPMASGSFRAPDCANFCSVPSFLEKLLGRSPGIKHRKVKGKQGEKTIQALLAELYDQWKDWKVGFSHFVQLPSEPTELCVWTMLSRRAAGVLSRDGPGVDLVIPVVSSSSSLWSGTEYASESSAQVSLILVRVSGESVGLGCSSSNSCDDELNPLSSATRAMHPSRVFSSTNHFHSYGPSQVIRVHMSMTAASSSGKPKTPTQFLFVDESDGESTTHPRDGSGDGLITLCLEGVGNSASESDSVSDNGSESDSAGQLEFVPPGVVAQLAALLEHSSRNRMMEMVEADVDARRACVGTKRDWVVRGAALMSEEELVEGAELSLCGGFSRRELKAMRD